MRVKKIILLMSFLVAVLGSVTMAFLILPFVFVLHKSLVQYDKLYFLAAIIVSSMFILIFFQNRNGEKSRLRIACIRLFFLSVVVKIVAVLFIGINTQQISDYSYAFEQSVQSIPLYSEYYAVFSNWALYSEYLKILNIFFGASVFNGVMSNVILSSFSTSLIYILVYRTTRNKKWAYSSAGLYAIWPSNVTSVILLTPEYLHIFFMLSAIILLFELIRNYSVSTFKNNLFLGVGMGILFALSGFFKPIDKIAYIALMIMGVSFFVRESFSIKRGIILYSVILLVAFISSSLIYSHLDSYVGIDVNRDPKMSFIYIGLTPNGVGTWSQETSIYLDYTKRNNFDYKKTDDIIKSKLVQEIKEIPYDKLKFFLNKVKIAWGSEIYPSMVNATIDINGAVTKDVWIERIRAVNEVYYLLMILLFLFSMGMTLYRKQYDYSWWLVYYSFLLIFGFFCLLLLSEVQDRYKLVIYPYISIIAGRIVELKKKVKVGEVG